MCVMISLIQVTLLGVVVFVFYVIFGVLSVSKVTATQWIGSPPAEFGGVLSGLPVSQPLVQVCMVLAAFSALNFIVSIGTDPTYRTTFLEPALDEVRQGLQVRDEYVALRKGTEDDDAATATSGPALTSVGGDTTTEDAATASPAAETAQSRSDLHDCRGGLEAARLTSPAASRRARQLTVIPTPVPV